MAATRANTLENVRRLTCENDQAELDLFSRLACSTLLSKILTALRLSGAVWIEARTVRSGCPRTCCACCSCVSPHSAAFLRELFKLIELSSLCQALSFLYSRPLKLDVGGHSSNADFDPLTGRVPFKKIAQRKISKIDQR